MWSEQGAQLQMEVDELQEQRATLLTRCETLRQLQLELEQRLKKQQQESKEELRLMRALAKLKLLKWEQQSQAAQSSSSLLAGLIVACVCGFLAGFIAHDMQSVLKIWRTLL